ncbi:hypothetical protein D0869_02274 [Hortaea werneckii]|uniref:non-specific serine/threonine protein kinase n=1 Tax=Hortaea werneckii TaxID=91943 RepID=A0A3M6XAJ5_HORWE|nr:hypothetical protein D0869_02274 [Hortaea werneckii]
MSTAHHSEFHCEIEGEALNRYKHGGYHPIHIGDTLNGGRYTIHHKLGWGGYGTSWLAYDKRSVLNDTLTLLDWSQSFGRYAAIKVSVSELSDSWEVEVHRHLAKSEFPHLGRDAIVDLFQDFTLDGPNGTHSCLVTEVLGPSVPFATERFSDNRLPGRMAWQAIRDTTKALALVHSKGIVYGGSCLGLLLFPAALTDILIDLHPGNVLFAGDKLTKQPHIDISKVIGRPVRADVHVTHYSASLPKYMIEPISFPPSSYRDGKPSFKLIDFGSSFFLGQTPPKMRCPLPFRAPEAVMKRDWGMAADIWSLGCTVCIHIARRQRFGG